MEKCVNELFFATKNKDKILKMKNRLKDFNFKILTPYDIDIDININEKGKNVIENAMIKAKEYYKIVKIPTVATDSSLYVEKFERQPGLFIKRINGIELNDNELEEYYINELDKIGGKSKAYYITGVVLVKNDNEVDSIEIKEDEFIFTSKMCNGKRNYDPLSRLEYDEKLKKYFCQLTVSELSSRGYTFDEKTKNFIVTRLEMKKEDTHGYNNLLNKTC